MSKLAFPAMRRFAILAAILLSWHTLAVAQLPSSPSAVVREVLSQHDERLDYARAKLAFDQIIDPSISLEAAIGEVRSLATRAAALAGSRATDIAKLTAVQRVIYRSGAWNGNRPFSYDLTDPFGQTLRNKLLSTYLATRRGNCISMPILFLLVGERLGLNLSLSTAPFYVFVQYADATGRVMNIEATSGGNPAPTARYRQGMPMSDRSIENGLYMRPLTKREGIAHMAATVMEWLMTEGRFQEAIEVAEIILQHYPRDGYTMVKLGTAYAELMRIEFVERYPNPAMIPPGLRMRYAMLAQRNEQMFQAAEALGWEQPRN